MRRFLRDESGAILSAELILLVTMLVIGIVAGLKIMQDAINTELADVANAIGSMNQSFSWFGATVTNGGGSSGSQFTDSFDVHDNQSGANGTNLSSIDVAGNPPTLEVAP